MITYVYIEITQKYNKFCFTKNAEISQSCNMTTVILAIGILIIIKFKMKKLNWNQVEYIKSSICTIWAKTIEMC